MAQVIQIAFRSDSTSLNGTSVQWYKGTENISDTYISPKINSGFLYVMEPQEILFLHSCIYIFLYAFVECIVYQKEKILKHLLYIKYSSEMFNLFFNMYINKQEDILCSHTGKLNIVKMAVLPTDSIQLIKSKKVNIKICGMPQKKYFRRNLLHKMPTVEKKADCKSMTLGSKKVAKKEQMIIKLMEQRE